MKKISILTALLSFFITFIALADESTAQSTKNVNTYTNSFLSENWIGGMCRGGLHILSAPLLVPTSLAYGAMMPFKSDPELGGTTNYYIYAAQQTVITPLFIAANVGAGAGGCCMETIAGLFDLISFGHYDLPEYDKERSYDSRPYFLQLVERMRSRSRRTGMIVMNDEAKRVIVRK